jgi:signal transduction histidine kinase
VPDASRGRAVDAVVRNAQGLARLVDDLLDSSRGMAGALHLEVGWVDVPALIRGAVEAVGQAADGKEVRLDVHVAADAGTIAGDAARLQQVVWNLLANAVKFTPPGGTVRVQATREAGLLAIVVEDSGVGISADFLPHVFDRFRQEHTGTTRQFGGLGLGLAIARHIIELHGGAITADSEGPGRGARFLVTLPAQVAAPAAT